MKTVYSSIVTALLLAAPTAAVWAESPNLNPGNSGGGNAPIAVPTYGSDQASDPALTTGSRYSLTPNTPVFENPTVSGATGDTIVRGDNSTISGDRRATIQQKTGGAASDAPG